MMKQSFKPAAGFRLLAQYQQIIRQQQLLLQQIKQVLPENLAGQLQYCVVSGKKLLLYTSSGNWSSSLRFYQQAVLQQAQESGWTHLQVVQVKIIPERMNVQKRSKPLPPSIENAKMIQQIAASQTDAQLKQALSRLGQTLAKKATAS
jgi:hypothetical protein